MLKRLGVALGVMGWLVPVPVSATEDYLFQSFHRYTFRFENLEIVKRGLFSKDIPDFTELERESARFSTYEQFLDFLLERAPSLKRHFVLLHHSASQQLASLEHPRVILFDGGKAFAFSEHPANRENRVEILETDPITYQVRMREIIFSEGKVQLVRDPKSCSSCHGSSPKPLWDPYDFWPNAFGSSVGRVSTRQEAEAYQSLREKAASSLLLSRLVLKPKIEIGSEEVTPFTQYISQINSGRWFAQELGAGKATRETEGGFRFALLAVLSGCFSGSQEKTFSMRKREFFEFFREHEYALIEDGLTSIYDDVARSREHTKRFQEEMLEEFFPGAERVNPVDHSRLGDEVMELAFFRWVIDRMGLDGSNLSTSLLGNDYLVSTPSHFAFDFMTQLYELRRDLFAGLTVEIFGLGAKKAAYVKLNCEELKGLSRVAARDWKEPRLWTSYRRLQSARPVVSRCAKCHTEGLHLHAPEIPFHDSLKLAERIRDPEEHLGEKILSRIKRRGAGAMPPGRPLDEEEIASMEAFIEALR